jgi:hypothetical protein
VNQRLISRKSNYRIKGVIGNYTVRQWKVAKDISLLVSTYSLVNNHSRTAIIYKYVRSDSASQFEIILCKKEHFTSNSFQIWGRYIPTDYCNEGSKFLCNSRTLFEGDQTLLAERNPLREIIPQHESRARILQIVKKSSALRERADFHKTLT